MMDLSFPGQLATQLIPWCFLGTLQHKGLRKILSLTLSHHPLLLAVVVGTMGVVPFGPSPNPTDPHFTISVWHKWLGQ